MPITDFLSKKSNIIITKFIIHITTNEIEE